MSKSHGTLQVTIVEGRHLKDEDIVGKNDAFVEVYLDKEYKQRTKTVNNSNDPKWDEKFTLWDHLLGHEFSQLSDFSLLFK